MTNKMYHPVRSDEKLQQKCSNLLNYINAKCLTVMVQHQQLQCWMPLMAADTKENQEGNDDAIH